MDIYTGSGGIKKGEVFKGSYHASGQKHLKVLGRMVSKDQLPKPDKISGAIRVSAGSGDLNELNWDYKPKAESQSRRNLIIDLRQLQDVPGFTAELWAIEPKLKDAVENVLKDYREKCRILVELHIDWITPELLLFIWTFTPKGWTAVSSALTSRS